MLCSQVSTYKTWLLSSLQVPPKEEKYCLVSSKEEEVVKDAFYGITVFKYMSTGS